MYEILPLFELPEEPFKNLLADALRQLAERNLFVGASSWKYEGWLGSIYSPQRYSARGRFSRKRFESECLREYAEVFRIVSGDFAFYRFPTVEFWRSLFAQTAPPFRFAFKAPEDITAPAFPMHSRYGARAGQINPLFLRAEAFEREFLTPLQPYSDRVALIMFEFPASAANAFANVEQFAEAPSRFRLRRDRRRRRRTRAEERL
jgi:uncharacterized protein YecE (DUF72 family)